MRSRFDVTSSPCSPVTGPTNAGGGPRRNLEVIEYTEDVPLVDHKGRSRPIYKATRPRPHGHNRWHPSPIARLLLGLLPGARLTVAGEIRAGVPYLVVGLVAVIGWIILLSRLNPTLLRLAPSGIDGSWAILHIGTALGLVFVYELSRLGSSFEERSVAPRTARAISALAIPSLFLVLIVPTVVTYAPRVLEASWLAALIIFLGTMPAVLRCAAATAGLEDYVHEPRPKLIALAIAVVCVLGVLLALLLSPELRGGLVKSAAGAGFQTLPGLLR